MTTKLFVDSNNELQEVELPDKPQGRPVLKGMATLFSYIFHPVFVPVYLVAFLLYVQPFLFAGISGKQKGLILIQAVLMYTFFPLVAVGLLKALKFISSFKLEDRKDRIIPFIISNIWYFWLWYVWRNLPEIPDAFRVFAMGVFLASAIGLLFNIYMKISMHAIALGVVLTFLCVLALTHHISNVYLVLAFLAAGWVSSARLILNDHHPAEIYWGLATGFLAILLANIVA